LRPNDGGGKGRICRAQDRAQEQGADPGDVISPPVVRPLRFASGVYALLLFQRDVPNAERLFRLIALVIGGSIIAHSSSNVLLARICEGRARRAGGAATGISS
jgi:hypothetical protein